ncbi:MAG: hypothetical protein F4114_18080 [Rhodospirillaceae bacterium]|nr:hypothetical protein [Rhodospirillaceae bacterium]MYI50978.1 hypothetical protein [Rhodospirillaceae bacterium]
MPRHILLRFGGGRPDISTSHSHAGIRAGISARNAGTAYPDQRIAVSLAAGAAMQAGRAAAQSVKVFQ